jgi:oligopeptide transport system permease protein
LRYVLGKFLQMVVALWLVITVTFVLMKAIPGDPFAQEQGVPQEVIAALRRHYHLDQPWYQQYWRYLRAVSTWDLGPSFTHKARDVTSIIAQGFPVSATLGMEALALALSFGLLLGVLSACHHNGWVDRASMIVALLGISIPSFLLAAILQYVFAVKLGVLPVARWGTVAQSILPALSLAALPTAVIARLMRSSMLEVLRCEHLKTARAKGLSEFIVLWRHGLRNALAPVVTYLGPLAANILVGSFVVERIYGIPGLGQWFVHAVSNRDYTMIMGMTVFYAALLLFCVFLVDVVTMLLDPRVQLRQQAVSP